MEHNTIRVKAFGVGQEHTEYGISRGDEAKPSRTNRLFQEHTILRRQE